MRDILSTPNNNDSWKRTSIFHTFIPLNKKSCKLVIDGGISMNVISKTTVDRFGLKVESHPCPFKVAWVDKIFLPIKEHCLVTLKLGAYYEKIYCEILPMNVAHLLLGHPWLYENAMKHCGCNNIYKFKHNNTTIFSTSVKSVTRTCPVAKSSDKKSPTHQFQILTYKHFEKESVESGYVFGLVVAESFTMPSESTSSYSPDVSCLIDEFNDVMPDKLPDGLPPLRDIQHAIDLVPRSQLPNIPFYRINPIERAELNRQIEGLLEKGFVGHSLSPCIVPILLITKKDGS